MGGIALKKQKKIAVINDFSGFGRCSLTVSIPVISAMKIQCCALPTAVFSNHTGYDDYFFDDYTDKMQPYYLQWEKLGLQFDGIYTGFLGSVRQTEIVMDFIKRFAKENTKVIVDPVMGDNGRIYDTFNSELCRSIKKLLPLADIITPNLTEACILTEIPYTENPDKEKINEIAQALRQLGSRNIVITGVCKEDYVMNYIFEEETCTEIGVKNTGTQRAGTGDVFASIIAADTVNGVSLYNSVKKASLFVKEAIILSDEMHIPTQDGICFEEILNKLN